MQVQNLGIEVSEDDSDTDEPELIHMPAVQNPLTDLQYAELLLCQPTTNVTVYNCRDFYCATREFVMSKVT